MKIGELALAAQTQVETIRYYEREGLLPQAPRSEGNYRIYGPEHVERLAFAALSCSAVLGGFGALSPRPAGSV